MASTIDYAEVAKHNTPADCWVVVGTTVYNLSEFAPSHPGGAKYIHKYAGKVHPPDPGGAPAPIGVSMAAG